ncbi:hypothetical protein GH5_06154 [Leishmania sp. Ghana 2012 LV757]|uniref:hypothetical protein n=1 Tax=Leishmania sp. Ghana 2012 LV757 TaxID=2803181 RepID=UPI001B4393B9|nr:hypothetical protein GH5_06154 [Leishmania sp. Ghana 2012 LV757]
MLGSTSDSPPRGTGGDGATPKGVGSSPSAASPVAAASLTSVQALQAELQRLRERLHVSDEWNMRLQYQLQALLQLPHNEVEGMRDRMQDPDIAIPLLQCYDAVIHEKTEEVERLRRETADLQSQLDAFHKDQLDVSNAVRMTEELAKSVQGKATAEAQRSLEAVRGLQEELVRLRIEMARALDAENAAKQDALRTAERAISLERALEVAKQTASTAETAREAAERKLKLQEQQAGEEQTGSAVQTVQLQLMTQENANKAQELERLRSKMAQALRQASDNHAAHLRIVEERHRMVVEGLRSVNRTQELEMMKLRAQLARWDPGNSPGAGRPAGAPSAPTSSLRFQSTAELLEAQTRQAQEMELKRLYGEVSTLQLQRNDAVRQSEQRTARLQREYDQQLQDVQRQLQSAQRHLSEVRSRCEKLEETSAAQEASLRKVRDELRQAKQDSQQHRLSAESNARKLASTQKQLAESNERLSALQEEKQSATRKAQEGASELEANVTRALQEVQSAKEHAYAEVEEVQRRYEQLRVQNAKLQDHLREREAALVKKERERRILAAQLGRLEDGLEAHKRQVVESERRVQLLEQQLAGTRQQQRDSFLSLEQMKLQNTQLTRMRDQLAEMLHARSF